MNVTDLYYILYSGNFKGKSFTIDVEEHMLLGFIKCDNNYVHATLPKDVVRDITQNNTEYIKCIYYGDVMPPTSNTLSLLSRMDKNNSQIFMYSRTLKDEKYYIGAGLIMNDNKDILLSICKRDCYSDMNKLIISPRVFVEKTRLNKYIVSKIIPEFACNGMEIDIRNKEYIYLKTGLMSGVHKILDITTDTSNAYELCGMGT